MSRSGNNPFNIKLGRIFAPDGTGRFISLAGRVKHRANRISRSGGTKKKVPLGAQYFSRRVIVKVSLVKMGVRGKTVQTLHLDYIGRNSATMKNERGENEKGILYGPDENIGDADAFTQRGSEDRHQFRIIVSPEDSRDMSNLHKWKICRSCMVA